MRAKEWNTAIKKLQEKDKKPTKTEIINEASKLLNNFLKSKEGKTAIKMLSVGNYYICIESFTTRSGTDFYILNGKGLRTMFKRSDGEPNSFEKSETVKPKKVIEVIMNSIGDHSVAFRPEMIVSWIKDELNKIADRIKKLKK